jgi:general secretion pathway protein G
MDRTVSPAVSIESNEREDPMKAFERINQRLLFSRPRRLRGVTLFEVLIVVAILAMVAGGVAFFALPKFKEAQVKTAESAARIIRQAAQSWQATNSDGGCPTVSQLVQDKLLDPGQNTADPWGQAFVISCTEDDVVVLSTGGDKKKGTKDDVMVPKSAAPAGGE